MKKSEPRAILNFSIQDDAFEEKMNVAIKNYMETYTNAHLEEELDKLLGKKVEKRLLSFFDQSHPYYLQPKINGKTLDNYISGKVNGKIEEIIDRNIKEIFAKKVAEMF